MPHRRRRSFARAAVFSVVAVVSACAPASRETELASSSQHVTYASRFAEALHQVRTEFMDAERESTRILGEARTYPDALKEPSWAHVAVVVQRADEAGRSRDYVSAHEESLSVARFFDQEKDPLGRKVGGAAQYVAKQKGCTADVQTPATHALGKAVTEALQDRLREANPAHSVIDDYQQALLAENLPALRRQADDLTLSSYLSHVAAPRAASDLVRMVGEVDSVRQTLEAEVADARAAQDAAADEDRKKSAKARQSRAIEAKAKLDGQVEPARALAEEVEERASRAREAHDAAVRELRAALDAKAGAARK